MVAVACNFHLLDILCKRTWQDLEGAEHKVMDQNSYHSTVSALTKGGT